MASTTSGRTPRVSTSYLKIKMAMLREVMMGSDLGRGGKKKKDKSFIMPWKEIFEDGQRDEYGRFERLRKSRI